MKKQVYKYGNVIVKVVEPCEIDQQRLKEAVIKFTKEKEGKNEKKI